MSMREGHNVKALTALELYLNQEESREDKEEISSDDSSDDEITDESLIDQLQTMYNKWKRSLEIISRHKQRSASLAQEVNQLKKELMHERSMHSQTEDDLASAKTEAARVHKNISMLNNGTKQLDHLLDHQRTEKGRPGLGYTDGQSSGVQKFVPASNQSEQKGEKMIINRSPSTSNLENTRVCHFCNHQGHIKSGCKHLLSKPVRSTKKIGENKRVWKPMHEHEDITVKETRGSKRVWTPKQNHATILSKTMDNAMVDSLRSNFDLCNLY